MYMYILINMKGLERFSVYAGLELMHVGFSVFSAPFNLYLIFYIKLLSWIIMSWHIYDLIIYGKLTSVFHFIGMINEIYYSDAKIFFKIFWQIMDKNSCLWCDFNDLVSADKYWLVSMVTTATFKVLVIKGFLLTGSIYLL